MTWHSRYPEDVEAFIFAHHSEYSSKEMAEELKARFGFDRKPEQLLSYCKNRRLAMRPLKGRSCPEHSKFPLEMHGYVREIAWGRSYKEITQMINDRFGEGTITTKQIHSYLKNHKIKTGRTGCFAKGGQSWNKGKKIEEIIKDPEKRRRFQESQFKKGHVPQNQYPIGTIIKNTDGYLMRKKQMEGTQWERWEFLHRAMWEEANGPIPDGMLVAFKDSNPENCTLDNLVLISRAEHAALNNYKYRSSDPDLTMAGIALLRVSRQRIVLKDKKRKEKKKQCMKN